MKNSDTEAGATRPLLLIKLMPDVSSFEIATKLFGRDVQNRRKVIAVQHDVTEIVESWSKSG